MMRQLCLLQCLLWMQLLLLLLLTQSFLKMILLLDVVNDKEDLVVFPRFVGNICLNTNG